MAPAGGYASDWPLKRSPPAAYDHAIAGFLNREQEVFAAFRLDLPLELRLRYGENLTSTRSFMGTSDHTLRSFKAKSSPTPTFLTSAQPRNLSASSPTHGRNPEAHQPLRCRNGS